MSTICSLCPKYGTGAGNRRGTLNEDRCSSRDMHSFVINDNFIFWTLLLCAVYVYIYSYAFGLAGKIFLILHYMSMLSFGT